LLFYFTYKYVRKPGVKAYYFPHNNKLEMIWTVVPACVLAVIIILGLKKWNEATSESGEQAIKIELYSKQFDWTARYAGNDNKLGRFDYKLTTDKNELGLMTAQTIDSAIFNMQSGANSIDSISQKLNYAYCFKKAKEAIAKIVQENGKNAQYRKVAIIKVIDEINCDFVPKGISFSNILNIPEPVGVDSVLRILSNYAPIYSEKDQEKLEVELSRKTRLIRLLHQMKEHHQADLDKDANDDIIQKDTLFLCKGKEYEFTFRAKDVIHSAYFPHFRAQVNTVPGMTTRFKFTPDISTKEMQAKKNDSKFNYVLMCNKICGGSHYKMKMLVVVLEENEYNAWWKSKQSSTFAKVFSAAPAPAEGTPADSEKQPDGTAAPTQDMALQEPEGAQKDPKPEDKKEENEKQDPVINDPKKVAPKRKVG